MKAFVRAGQKSKFKKIEKNKQKKLKRVTYRLLQLCLRHDRDLGCDCHESCVSGHQSGWGARVMSLPNSPSVLFPPISRQPLHVAGPFQPLHGSQTQQSHNQTKRQSEQFFEQVSNQKREKIAKVTNFFGAKKTRSFGSQ